MHGNNFVLLGKLHVEFTNNKRHLLKQVNLKKIPIDTTEKCSVTPSLGPGKQNSLGGFNDNSLFLFSFDHVYEPMKIAEGFPSFTFTPYSSWPYLEILTVCKWSKAHACASYLDQRPRLPSRQPFLERLGQQGQK